MLCHSGTVDDADANAMTVSAQVMNHTQNQEGELISLRITFTYIAVNVSYILI